MKIRADDPAKKPVVDMTLQKTSSIKVGGCHLTPKKQGVIIYLYLLKY